MLLTTPKLALKYPDADEPPDLTHLLQQLALSVEGVVLRGAIKTFTATTDTNGYINTTHGLGFTPGAVIAYNATPGTSFATFWGADLLTATTFRTRWAEARGTPYPLSGATVQFVAVCLA